MRFRQRLRLLRCLGWGSRTPTKPQLTSTAGRCRRDDGYATLSDPSDSLGNGTQLVGAFDSAPYAFDHSESNQLFNSDPADISIEDSWRSPWLVVSTVQGNDGSTGGATEGYFTTNLGGNEVVDLYNSSDSYPPLVNPDVTGPIDVGGLALASPQDGALFNDL